MAEPAATRARHQVVPVRHSLWHHQVMTGRGAQVGMAFSKVAHTRRGVAGLAVGLAAIGLALSAIGSGPAKAGTAQPGRAVPSAAIHRLAAIAAGFIRADGDQPAGWESAVITTPAQALTPATPGDTTADADTIVYLITIKGHFTATGAPGPAAARAPTGSYLSIVVNAT